MDKPASHVRPKKLLLLLQFERGSSHPYEQSCRTPKLSVQSHTYNSTFLVSRPRTVRSSCRHLDYCNLTVKDPMEATTGNLCAMPALRSDLANACSDSKRFMPLNSIDVGAKSPSFETDSS